MKISIALDTRRQKKKTGTFPVVLLIRINGNPQRYQTIFDLSREDFVKLQATRVSSRLHPIKEKLHLLQHEPEAYIEEHASFDLWDFENNFVCENPKFKPRKKKIRQKPLGENLFDFTPYEKGFPILKEVQHEFGHISTVYLDYIVKLIQEERIGTARSYQESYFAIKKFKGDVKFTDITVSFLVQYERWILKSCCSKATVGIRMRPLRAIFNEAMENKIAKRDSYPFGRKKYKIPSGKNIKKSLGQEDVAKIFHYSSENVSEMRAKDYCGLNPKSWRQI